MLSPGSVTTVNAGEQPDLPEAGSPSAQRSGVLEARSRPAPDCQPIRFEAGPAGLSTVGLGPIRISAAPGRRAFACEADMASNTGGHSL